MRRHLAFLLVAAPFVGFALACGGLQEKLSQEASEKLIEAGTGTDVEISGDGTTTSVNLGGATYTAGSTVSLPSEFPSDVPMYPNANLTVAAMLGPGNFTVGFDSTASEAEIVGFYKEKLTGPFQLTAETAPPGAMLMFTTPDQKRSVMVTFSGTTPVQVAMGVTQASF